MNCIICKESFPDLPPETQTCFHCFMKYGPPPKVGDLLEIIDGGKDTEEEWHNYRNGDIVKYLNHSMLGTTYSPPSPFHVDPVKSKHPGDQILCRTHFRTLRGDEAP